jgi:hypothetical protein
MGIVGVVGGEIVGLEMRGSLDSMCLCIVCLVGGGVLELAIDIGVLRIGWVVWGCGDVVFWGRNRCTELNSFF